MPQIRLENVTFGYTEPLFTDVTLTIGENDRVGIVGNNGGGKSTLLKCIAGEIEPHQGRVIRSRGMRAGFIEQDIPDNLRDMMLYDVISAAIPADERDYNLWQVDIALDTFKTPTAIRNKPVKELSGGWQRLALIARTWVSKPDALLLDEPTNHLDVAKIFVLEQWLNEQVRDVPVAIISHDRGFLDSCTNRTLFLRSSGTAFYSYPYSRAKELLIKDDEAKAAQRANEMKEIKRLQESARNLRQIGVDNFSGSALRKSVQIANRAEALEADMTETHVEKRRDIRLSNSGSHAKRMIDIKDVVIKTPDGAPLFHIDRLTIFQGDRLVILGANGSGKSRLLSYIREAFTDIEGAKTKGISITPSATQGVIDQHLSQLPVKVSVRDYILHEFNLGNQKTTAILVNAGFPLLLQDATIGVLSYGQRARLALLALRLMEPNFYIMDEPTNHLDIAGLEQLESEILEHGASCILVSHDRTFAANIGTKFYVINNRKLAPVDEPKIFYDALLGLSDTEGQKLNLGRGSA